MCPTVEEVQQMVQTSIDNQQDLQRLADALSDHAMTREAADLINEGNYAEAAEELRDVANQADQLSDEARAESGQRSESGRGRDVRWQQDAFREHGTSRRRIAGGRRTGPGRHSRSCQRRRAKRPTGAVLRSARSGNGASSGAISFQPNRQGQGSDAGNIGQKSPNEQSGNSSEQETSSASGQQQGQPGEADSDSGANAEAGIGDNPQSSSGESGEGAPADAEAPGNSEGQQGDSEGQPQPGGGSGSSIEDPAQAQSDQEGNPNQGPAPADNPEKQNQIRPIPMAAPSSNMKPMVKRIPQKPTFPTEPEPVKGPTPAAPPRIRSRRSSFRARPKGNRCKSAATPAHRAWAPARA